MPGIVGISGSNTRIELMVHPVKAGEYACPMSDNYLAMMCGLEVVTYGALLPSRDRNRR